MFEGPKYALLRFLFEIRSRVLIILFHKYIHYFIRYFIHYFVHYFIHYFIRCRKFSFYHAYERSLSTQLS